jgi:hypothetical protein
MTRHQPSTKEQKKLADDARLLRAWKKFHLEERLAVLAGPHGAMLAELFRAFDNLAHIKPVQLIGLVHAVDWTTVNYDARLIVLHELNVAITKFRVKRGAEPINDNLPGQPETPFRVIRAIIHQVPHVADVAPTGAQPGTNTNQPTHRE